MLFCFLAIWQINEEVEDVKGEERKVDVYDYHEMLDYTEERFEELFEKYPENKELLEDLRGILRFYQLCMNLILAKADKNSYFVTGMLTNLPEKIRDKVLIHMDLMLKNDAIELLKKSRR